MEPIRVAYAEDFTMIRKSICSMLTSSGEFEIIADASNGKELLDQLAKLPQPPQIFLLDIKMPEMDGYQTLVALRKLYPKVPALILSQFDDEFAIIKMLKAGASGYLHKDEDPTELKEAMRVILGGTYYQNKMVTGRIMSLVRRGDAQLVLSDAELAFLPYVCSELTYKEIADLMVVSKRTVDGYRERLFEKLGVKSRTALALYALKLGIAPYQQDNETKSNPGSQ
jgi:DNA-binding NarL/FixJ family response regulator